MTSEYRCENPGRREALRSQDPVSVNAIDYVVVADREDMPADLRQRVLAVRFFFELGLDTLSVDNFALRGGVRVVDPSLRWAERAPFVATNPSFDDELDAAAHAWLGAFAASLSEPQEWFLLLLEGRGDFSRYTLVLRLDPSNTASEDPPAGFDRRLSEVELSLKVDCINDFDCAEADRCMPTTREGPELDYLARDFASFRRLMFERLALHDGGYTQEPADLRTTLVEVLAYAADQLAYFQDAVATEAHLSTARLRSSVRRHARLLDYHMHEGCNARAVVHLEMSAGASLIRDADEDPLIGVGARFLTTVPEMRVVIGAASTGEALSHAPTVFELMRPVRVLRATHNSIRLHTWGDDDCCLPKGTTQASLVVPGEGLSLAVGDLLLFEEVRDPDSGVAADADPGRRHVVRLTAVSDPYPDGLLPETILDVGWGVEDALPFPLFASSKGEPISLARANLVLVDHGRTTTTAASDALEQRVFGLDDRNRIELPTSEGALTWAEALASEDGGRPVSAAKLLAQDPRAAVPQLLLGGEGERWAPARDLLSSTSSSRAFVVETESDGRAWLRFGDDKNGRRPDPSTSFEATYRVGTGKAGNVGAGAISHLIDDEALTDDALATRVAGIRNPLPASGGRNPESITEVKLYAPRAFRRQERAVTCEDWAEVAGRHPEIQRAVATIRWTGSWNTVFLNVDRNRGKSVDAAFEAELLEFFERYRMAGYDLEIAGPRWVPLDIALTVCVAEGHLRDVVAGQLAEVFGVGWLDDGTRAFFHPDNFSFGEPVYLSQVVARATAVPGVRWIDSSKREEPTDNDNRFQRWGHKPAGELEQGYVPISRLEIARCDNDPNLPDNGRIRFFMEGGA